MYDHHYTMNHQAVLQVLYDQFGEKPFYPGNISSSVREYENGTLSMDRFSILLLAEGLLGPTFYLTSHAVYDSAKVLLEALVGKNLKGLVLNRLEKLTPKGAYSYTITKQETE